MVMWTLLFRQWMLAKVGVIIRDGNGWMAMRRRRLPTLGDRASTRRRKCAKGLGDEWLTLVSPLEGLGHGVVVVIDEGQNLGLQLVKRRERASAQEFAGQNA